MQSCGHIPFVCMFLQHYDQEQEILLAAGTVLTVTQMMTIDGTVTILMEEKRDHKFNAVLPPKVCFVMTS